MEKVYVELDWYDGPRSGVADYNGIPHRFISKFDDTKGYSGSFSLISISVEDFELEVEQWKIFVKWNDLYESGKASTESHPAHGGISQRWDEIEKILKDKRNEVPPDAIRVSATFEHNNQDSTYAPTGPCYGVIWHLENSK